MTALILSYTWLWQDAFPGDFLLCVALYLGIAIRGHLRRGETAREIGFRVDNAGPAMGQALLFVGPLIVVTVLVGLMLGTINLPRRATWLIAVPRSVCWGTLQQYGLLAFYYRRLGEVLSGSRTVIVAAACLFALFHLPNPFLTPVTLLAGALSCWLYRRVPNLLVLGLMHAALSIAIARSLPYEITFGLRVGPGFFTLLENLRAGG